MLDQHTFFSIQDLSVSNDVGVVLSNINLIIKQQRKVGIVGETGSGKTTLLKAMAGLEQAAQGGVWLEGKQLKGPEEQLIPGHPQIAYLSQYSSLKNNYRISELFEFNEANDKQYTHQLCEICKIDHLVNRWTDELSGGERQRVAMAILLLSSPKILLLDEPYSNLDNIHKELMKKVLTRLMKELSITCIMVSHDIPDLLSWADDLVIMKNGSIIQTAPPLIAFQQPEDEYCAGLLGSFQLITQQQAKRLDLAIADFPDNKKLLIRPSFLSFSKIESGSENPSITSIELKGDFNIVHIHQNDLSFKLIALPNDHFAVGDSVQLKYQSNQFHFI